MAAIDTIEILDGLKHEQDQTTSILYDIDHVSDSVVGTYTVHVPLSASQARVIFNNNHDPNGSDVYVRVRVTKTTGMTTTGVTKTETTEALPWTKVFGNVTDGTDIVETGTIDVSDSRATTLHIDCCIGSTTAHTGTEIIPQIASEAGVDDAWTTIGNSFIGPTGTAIGLAFVATEPIAETVIAIANPVANNMDNDGKFKFVLNNVVADSEIVFQTLHGADV